MIKTQPAPYKYILPILFIYTVLSVTGMLHHEIFLEEAQQLTIGRDSNSIAGVFSNMLYEGHVTLWNSFLFFITHYISATPVYMQVFHLLVINCTVFVFLRYAPFNLPVKTLVVFGCYFLFVYSIISRNYALGILLLFICCILLANPAKNMLAIGCMVVLMCFTHLFYVFASIGIFIYLLSGTIGKRELYRRFALFTGLFLFGLVCALYQTSRVPGDSIVKPAPGLSWLNVHDISFSIICFARGYITIPPLRQTYFWDKQYIQHLPAAIGIITALLLFATTLFFLRKSKRALLFYVPPVLLLTAFFAMSHLAGSRYFGLYFIYFLVALWLANYDGVTIFPKGNTDPVKKWTPRALVYTILIIQFFTGMYMYAKDFKHPFSQAKNTIAYIKENHLGTQPLAVDGYNAGPALSAYLGKPILYLDMDQYGSFCIWKKAYLPYPRRTLADEISSSKHVNNLKEFILITNRSYGVNSDQTYTFTQLAGFNGAIIEGEDYYIYRVNKK